MANALKTEGVKKGDRVAIYMPVSPLLAASMLACARIGAVHRWADGHSSPSWSGIAHMRNLFHGDVKFNVMSTWPLIGEIKPLKCKKC